MRRLQSRQPRRLRLRVVVAVATLLLIVASGALWSTRAQVRDEHQPQPTPQGKVEPSRDAAPTPHEGAAQQDEVVAADLDGLKALTFPAASHTAEDQIPEEYRHQPDLYARAFVAQLLTQDFREARDSHLAWVQSESARTDEPVVAGLVPPELRDRLALFSVTDNSSGPSPVPGPADWARLSMRDARTTVTIQTVTEPLAWSNAVEAGRVTDPGVTARQVAATVTLQRREGGRLTKSKTSVALTLNLSGPPTRDTWAFVAVITYWAVPMGSA